MFPTLFHKRLWSWLYLWCSPRGFDRQDLQGFNTGEKKNPVIKTHTKEPRKLTEAQNNTSGFTYLKNTTQSFFLTSWS